MSKHHPLGRTLRITSATASTVLLAELAKDDTAVVAAALNVEIAAKAVAACEERRIRLYAALHALGHSDDEIETARLEPRTTLGAAAREKVQDGD